METALEKINGKVIPIDAVIHHGKHHLSVLSNIEGIEDENKLTAENSSNNCKQLSSALIPFTSLFDYYVNIDENVPIHTTEDFQSILRYNG